MFSRKITDYAVFGFKLSEEHLYQEVPVCVRSISMLIASNTQALRLQNELLGTWGYSHDLSTQTSPNCTCCNLHFPIHFRSFLPLHLCSHILHSYKPLVVVSFSVHLLLVRTDCAGLWGKCVELTSGLSFCFQGHDPRSSFRSLIMYSKQSASKYSKHNRLNARQSENFTEFLLKASSKLLKNIKCFFSNVKWSLKLFVF